MILYNQDNVEVLNSITNLFPLIYCDMIYEDMEQIWLGPCIDHLTDDGVIIIQTDYHSSSEVNLKLKVMYGLTFINWIVTHDNWGGRSKRCFGRKHDDILIYSKSSNYKFYPDRVMIPKVTAGTAFDKKGTGLQIPTDNWADLGNFSTMSNERVKLGEHNIQWQKSLKLMNRLLLPFSDEGDTILDPFSGSGTTLVWCLENNRDCVGIEFNTDVYNIALERIRNHPLTNRKSML